MKVEFFDCELGIGVALYVTGSEFLKADKSREEYCSLAAATEAFYNLHGIDYHIDKRDYETVKPWVKASDAVIFTIQTDRFEHKVWYEIHISTNFKYKEIIWSDDGRDYFTRNTDELEQATERPVRKQKGGKQHD